jgi:hypothetical protein
MINCHNLCAFAQPAPVSVRQLLRLEISRFIRFVMHFCWTLCDSYMLHWTIEDCAKKCNLYLSNCVEVSSTNRSVGPTSFSRHLIGNRREKFIYVYVMMWVYMCVSVCLCVCICMCGDFS